jgi:hypothetical protein
MTYIFNPKTEGSGIICAIPQTGRCPNGCEDCFFQSGRSYLEPLDEHLPNLPSTEQAEARVVRMNDGNDSNVKREEVEKAAMKYQDVFFNTAIPWQLETFSRPYVLTVNPGKLTDVAYNQVKATKNMMFVRIRTNTWNLENVVDPAVKYYTEQGVPVILTFMAYYAEESIPEKERAFCYIQRKRTLNSYWAITTEAWREIMARYQDNNLVYSCGHIEGEKGKSGCKHCGNCLREYYSTKERMRA